MIIRKAISYEYPILIENESRVFDSDIITKEDCRNFNTYVLDDEEGNILGHYISYIEENSSYLFTILINGSYRGKGFSNLLLEHYLTQESLNHTLHVNIDNYVAIHLYESYDFRQINIIRHFYENGEDAIFMRRENENNPEANLWRSRKF